jgi:pimeloyl-ACP methyl ester carboxylesterase
VVVAGGGGRRTLIALPGMDGGAHLFGPLRDSAPGDVDVVAIGYPSGAANDYDDLMPMVRAHLPADRPFYLLGWSFSGPLALMLAAQRPPGLRGVVMAASFVRDPVPRLPRWARRFATPALFRFYPAASRLKALLGGYGTPPVRAMLKRAHAEAGVVALAARARATLYVDATAALAACRVPVLYIRASRDEVVARSCADVIRRLQPSVEIAEIEGPHLALITNPGAAWAALTAFMNRVDSTAPTGLAT